MEFSIKHLDHVVLRVSDLDRAVRFYSAVLGCKEERRSEKYGLVQLRAGRSLWIMWSSAFRMSRYGADGRGPST